jgi:hypothetical protein
MRAVRLSGNEKPPIQTVTDEGLFVGLGLGCTIAWEGRPFCLQFRGAVRVSAQTQGSQAPSQLCRIKNGRCNAMPSCVFGLQFDKPPHDFVDLAFETCSETASPGTPIFVDALLLSFLT